MRLASRARLWLAALALLIPVLGLAAYKIFWLNYALADVLPRTEYRVTYDLSLDGDERELRIRTFLPLTDSRQQVYGDEDLAPGLRFKSEVDELNRVATWSGSGVTGATRIRHTFSVIPSSVRYEIDGDLGVADVVPAAVARYLQPEPNVQVDDPAIAATLRRIGADRGTLLSRLHRIFDLTAKLTPRAFKGTTDALTALRLGEASCNGRSRLFVALARAAGIPARLVGGLILENGSKRTSHQWVEVFVAGHWVPFCPTNGHFASLPQNYLTLYRGDEVLFKHSSDVNFGYDFVTSSRQVPSAAVKTRFQLVNVWALFDRLKLPFALLSTVLMLPMGALVVVLFRNVIGMPTFGTFLPALIAAAATETGIVWGIVGVLLVVLAVGGLRLALKRFELLHSPTLAILLAGVTASMLTVSLSAERLGIEPLTRISFFPIAVLAICAERFYTSLTETGTRPALQELGGTILVVWACFVVMSSTALQVILIGFPEALLLVVSANLYLGRWTGIRISEYVRFRRLLTQPGTT